MGHLLRLFSWRHAVRHPSRIVFSAIAVALGVALFVSVDIANHTVERSVARTVDDLSGRAQLRVVRKHGLGADARVLEQLRAVPGAIASPLLERTLAIPDLHESSLLLLGVDFFNDALLRGYSFGDGHEDVEGLAAAALFPDTIMVTRRFAERHHLEVGDSLVAETPRGRTPLLISGILANEGPARVFGGNFAIMEIRWAQNLFGLTDYYDRIEIAPDGIDTETLRRRIEPALGDEYSAQPIARRNTLVENALAQIRSLVAISAIALVVGLFIIYNSVSISVVERVREIGILRAIGARRRQILGTILIEWTLVGVIGALLGVAMGYALADLLIDFTARTVNMLVLAVDVHDLVLAPAGALTAMAVGTACSFAAALLPAITAMRVAPVELLRQGMYRYAKTPHYLHAFAAGAVLIVLSVVLTAGLAARLPSLVVLLLATVAFFAIALCAPQSTIWIARVTRPLLWRAFRIEGFLATDNLSKFPQRTALTVVAFGGAIAMMVASASLIQSFKESTRRWMDAAFPFDLSVNATDLSQSLYSTAAYRETILDEVRAARGVASVYGVKAAFVPFHGSDIMLIAIDMDEFLAMHRQRHKQRFGEYDDAATRATLRAGEGAFISSNLAAFTGLARGDRIELPTPDGARSFGVIGAVEDYSWPAGAVLIDRAAYRRTWRDDTVTYVDIRVREGVAIADAKRDVTAALAGRHQAFTYDVDDLKRIGAEAMDQSTMLAQVQVLIAMVIGFLGIVNTLLISVLRRTREIGLLRAVGTTRAQVRKTVTIEAVLIALAGGLFGVCAGLLGAAFPLRLFTLKLSGFEVPFAVPGSTIMIALSASLVLGLAASVLPARRAARQSVLDAIGYE
ncbi:MAG: FtsX-like permease family protein [Planctomycetota bacterium]